MRKPLKIVLAGALMLGFVPSAWAEDPYPPCTTEPSDKDEEAARGAFSAGKAAYEEGDYPRAIEYWRDAYRRACNKHDLLKNLALAYELSGHEKEAALALRTYLQRVPDAPDRDQRQRKIEVLEARAVSKATSEAQAQAEQERTKNAAPVGPATPAAPAPAPAQEPNVAPLIVAGGGGVLLVVGTLGYFIQHKKVKDFEDQCGGRTCNSASNVDLDAANRARTLTSVSAGVAVVGLAALGGGLVWYRLAPTRPTTARSLPVERARVSVAPALAPGFAGAFVSGSF
jgi:hypothetical protein